MKSVRSGDDFFIFEVFFFLFFFQILFPISDFCSDFVSNFGPKGILETAFQRRRR